MPPGERGHPLGPGPCKTRLFKELCKAGARGWRKGPLTPRREEGVGWGRKLGRGLGESGGGQPGGSEKRKTEEREEIRRQKPQSGFQRLLGKRPICMGWGGATPPARATKNGRLLTNPPPGVGRRTLELTNARSPRFLRPLLCLGGTDRGRGAFPGDPRQRTGGPAEPTPGRGDGAVPLPGPFSAPEPALYK